MELHLQLEMPLEALVLHHPAAAAAGSLGACLAVLAAAFGLWRLRSAAVAFRPDDPHGVHTDRTQTQQQPPSPKPQPEAPEKPRREARRTPRQLEVGGERNPCVASPRKETLFEARGCYELLVDDEDGQRGGDTAEGEDCCLHQEYQDGREADEGKTWAAAGPGVVCGGRGWGERWRANQLGWYLHQDVAALNGRVVRLWEDEKRLAATSRLVRRRRWEEVAW